MKRAALTTVAAAALMMSGCEFLPVIDNGPSNPTPSPSPAPAPSPGQSPGGNAPSAPQPQKGEVTGSAMLKVKMAVPSNGELVVELIELAPLVKGSDATEPKRLGDVRIPTKGKSGPWSYAIPYDKAKVDPAKLYGVQAKILVGDQLVFKSLKASLVLTNGKDARTDVNLVPAN
ncbi:MAG: YbaY family lipoprotein [Phycisphaerales bacterium]